MGQRLIISENERSQIAKMHGLIKEDAVEHIPSNLVGKTMDLYTDLDNKNVYGSQFMINAVDTDELKVRGEVDGNKFDILLTYNCECKCFTPRFMGSGKTGPKLYNTKMSALLNPILCANVKPTKPQSDF